MYSENQRIYWDAADKKLPANYSDILMIKQKIN
jgi:hypothetical protein